MAAKSAFWCTLWQHWDTKQHILASFPKCISAFHPLCQGQSVSRVMIMCVLVLNSLIKWLPQFYYSCSKHDLKHTCTQPSTCMYKSHHPNAQGQSKDFFITCKHWDTDTNQGAHTNTGWKCLSCPFIKAHGETLQIRLRWGATVCNPAQGHTATSSHTYTKTHISPQGCDRLAAYWSTGSAGYEAKTCLKYFTPI